MTLATRDRRLIERFERAGTLTLARKGGGPCECWDIPSTDPVSSGLTVGGGVKFAKNSSSQLKKTCLSSGVRFVQSILSVSGCIVGVIRRALIPGRVNRIMGGGPPSTAGEGVRAGVSE